MYVIYILDKKNCEFTICISFLKMKRIRVLLFLLIFFPQIDCLYTSIFVDIPKLIKSMERHFGYSPVYLFDWDIYRGRYIYIFL